MYAQIHFSDIATICSPTALASFAIHRCNGLCFLQSWACQMLPDSLKNEEGLWYLCLFLLPPAILCLHSMVLSAHTHIDTHRQMLTDTQTRKNTHTNM